MTLIPHTLSKRNAASAIVALFLFLVAAAFAAPVKFDIPALPAPDAIKLFIKQSGTRVAYVEADLKEVAANALVGEYEPAAGLEILLKGTGCVVSQRQAGWFSVAKENAQPTTGSVKGSLMGEGGKGLPNVLVTIRETAQSAETDKYGRYAFRNVAAGTYVLVASAPGYQTMHITDVQVKVGRELTLGKEDMRKASEGPLALEPFVVHADTVEQLEKFEVTGTRQKPFTTADVDIPRSVDDAQPYYIFDSKTIDQSGATNLEDLLKQRLSMDTTIQTNGQISGVNTLGNTSSINLRGLGTDKTLVLVNGRRMAGVTVANAANQPDLNGIPLSAVERIEILPSSASGIYGGSAIGGVINIILKNDYSGGEIRAVYGNTWDTAAPTRALSVTYGTALEGGKTHFMFNAAWADARPLLLGDRRQLFDRGFAIILQNSPSYFYTSIVPFLGALPNINVIGQPTLKNGTVLSSNRTFVPAGTSSSTPTNTLYSGLTANAGLWDFDLPASTENPTGLLQPFGVIPKNLSFMGTLSRQMSANLEVFAEFSRNDNRSNFASDPFIGIFVVHAAAPTNPFNNTVVVKPPLALVVPLTTESIAQNITLGAKVKLPFDWTSEFDLTMSKNRYNYLVYDYDRTALGTDLDNGVVNPFVDTLLYPLSLNKYLFSQQFHSSTNLRDLALRGFGPLWTLPWGTPTLTIGLEHRVSDTPKNIQDVEYPITVANSVRTTYFSRQQATDSGYAEGQIPLVKKDWLPLLYNLELQASGRSERYTVDTGTPDYVEFPNNPSGNFYDSPTLNGQPFSSKARYTSTNYTVGLKYQPVPELTLRASRATAFLPPTPAQLLKNPLASSTTTPVIDPTTGSSVNVQTISGGNPNLRPQNSKSWNAGIIWEPRWRSLQGLRLDAEYYRIDQFDAIASLSAQQIVSLGSIFPGRVTRNSSGIITLVDTSMVNLFRRETAGWDLSANYTLKTGVGIFNLTAVESIIQRLDQQVTLTSPNLNYVNFPAESGAAKYKSNGTLSWNLHGWTAGWTARYFSSYKQYGAAGGPTSILNNHGAAVLTYITPQGSDTIPSQIYHDLFLSYSFGKLSPNSKSILSTLGSRFLDGLSIQLNVQNIFDTEPPFDAFYSTNYYVSPYGDTRLRSFEFSVKKAF